MWFWTSSNSLRDTLIERRGGIVIVYYPETEPKLLTRIPIEIGLEMTMPTFDLERL